ncbi:TraR/DksA family transcriptional regulator [Microbacterium halophytorum]|uniref:TraR/DksA family transcriptional regulator n=1 Tax=Microbacterium halophytorum TaxID=2067568 RepID=UPI000CFDA532|nr:TraR/DksA C4-type zinc finger protein [Microbacterium halophytorum]
MNDKTASELRTLLLERREAVLERERAGDEALAIVADARSFATADDEHDPEGGTLSEEWSRVAGLGAEAERELDEIDSALAKLDAGEYGTCEQCGKRIPVGRLRVRPMAARCVDCAS